MSQIADQVIIRPYKRADRRSLRKISYETSFLGKADDLFDEPELLADALTLYFTDSEPQSCYVAEFQGKVIGYLVGAKNEEEMAKVSWHKIYPHLLWVGLIRGVFFKYKTFRFLSGLLVSALRGELHTPDFSKEYPAVLHINISHKFRGGGIGHRLIEKYCQDLTGSGVLGVRAPTMSDSARKFFESCGFEVLFKTNRSYLRYYFCQDIPRFIMGRKTK